uniref:Uncharacterized protein n=1 Tax=Lepeophtheirus salmonis TaxID=72036 RepID=A0A0K2T252_LEPSM
MVMTFSLSEITFIIFIASPKTQKCPLKPITDSDLALRPFKIVQVL